MKYTKLLLSFLLLFMATLSASAQYLSGAFTPATPSLWTAHNTQSGTPIYLSSACAAGTSTCSQTGVTITSGHLYIVGIINSSGGNLSGATFGGGGGSLDYCAGCSNTFTNCYSNDVVSDFTGDCGYTIAGTTATGTMVVTRSNTSAAWRWWYVDITRNTGSPTLDVAAARDQFSNAVNPVGVTLTGYTGTNDVVVQTISTGTVSTGCTTPNVPFTWIGSYTEQQQGNTGVAVLPGTGSIGTPPTWCIVSNKAAVNAISFY